MSILRNFCYPTGTVTTATFMFFRCYRDCCGVFVTTVHSETVLHLNLRLSGRSNVALNYVWCEFVRDSWWTRLYEIYCRVCSRWNIYVALYILPPISVCKVLRCPPLILTHLPLFTVLYYMNNNNNGSNNNGNILKFVLPHRYSNVTLTCSVLLCCSIFDSISAV